MNASIDLAEPVGTDFPVPEGTKCACVIAHIPFLVLDASLHLTPGLSIHGGFGAELPNHWKEWLGTTFSDRLKGKNFVVRASAPSAKPEILDNEHYCLAKEAALFFEAVLLFGASVADTPILLKGSQVRGEMEIRQIGDLESRLTHENHPYTVIDEAKLREAHQIWLRLRRIQQQPQGWGRFSKGVKALIQTSAEATTDERTHHWVRALEALLMTEQGRATKQFNERCQLFTGASPVFESLFADAYNTRSFVEHMNGLDSLQKPGEVIDDTAARVDSQSCDMELIALEVYRLILSSNSLLANFESDTKARAFWAQPAADREAAWPQKVVPTAIRAERGRELEDSRL